MVSKEKVKVGSVSYLNAKPLIYGLSDLSAREQIAFSIDYPSRLAQQLIDDHIDVGLVPVATIPLIRNAVIISDYCISAHRKVNSVCIYSEVPMEDVTHMYLDYQSRTSVRLAQILLEHFWKKEVFYLAADEDYISQIKGSTAGVIIGDRALKMNSRYPYIYDLSEAWYNMNGLDFVFAAWIANKELSAEFIHTFNQANAIGLDRIEEIAASNAVPYYDLKKYYTEDILYKFDERKKEGLERFIKYIDPDYKIQFHI